MRNHDGVFLSHDVVFCRKKRYSWIFGYGSRKYLIFSRMIQLSLKGIQTAMRMLQIWGTNSSSSCWDVENVIGLAAADDGLRFVTGDPRGWLLIVLGGSVHRVQTCIDLEHAWARKHNVQFDIQEVTGKPRSSWLVGVSSVFVPSPRGLVFRHNLPALATVFFGNLLLLRCRDSQLAKISLWLSTLNSISCSTWSPRMSTYWSLFPQNVFPYPMFLN